jgi:hypothetical protein
LSSGGLRPGASPIWGRSLPLTAPLKAVKKSVGRRKRLPHKDANPCGPRWDRRFRLSIRRLDDYFTAADGRGSIRRRMRPRNQDDHLPRDLPSRLRNRLMDSPFVSRAPREKPAAFLLRRPFSTNFSPRQCMHLPRSACGKLVHKPWRFRSVPEKTRALDRYRGSAFPNLRRRRAEARPSPPHFPH